MAEETEAKVLHDFATWVHDISQLVIDLLDSNRPYEAASWLGVLKDKATDYMLS
jgi:hypothetical protein